MDRLTLESTYIPHLRNQFAGGTPILFLGAGFSIGAKSTSGVDVPSAAQLTQQLWHLCFPKTPLDAGAQLQDIFETAQLTKPKELGDLLRRSFTVNADSSPPWYRELLTMPWMRVYTLNIDDLVTKVLSTENISRPVRAVSGTTTRDPVFDDSKLSVIHLNGTLADVPGNVTFSRSQFAQRRGIDPAYSQLRNDLLFRSVVFIGTSLEEGPLWEHLELRGPRGNRDERELRPRSYLVVPNLSLSKQALLSRYNIVWIPMSGEQFNTEILSGFRDERASGHAALKHFSSTAAVSLDRFDRVTDLAANDRSDGEYLLGADPAWSDVTKGRVAGRACFDELWAVINDLRANPRKRRFVIVTGTAGTGKTSALMSTALRLEADGVQTCWLDSKAVFSNGSFRRAVVAQKSIGALVINDADLYESRLSPLVRDALTQNPKLLVICESRSSKVDRLINRYELGDIEPVEYTVPPLVDTDVDALIDVLEKEHRLGRLKGMDNAERRAIFCELAGRQLLVAMHVATHGKDFAEKARDELRDLKGTEHFVYGLISVASAHRFALRQDDIGIACADDDAQWLRVVDALRRRKLVLMHGDGMYRSRHRVIAQFVYESLEQEGKLYQVLRALIRIGATKTTSVSPRDAAHARLLRTFINHNLMKRGVELQQARQIYTDFEEALSWNHHFWLHRGALELENENLSLAENFLRQAKAIEPLDVFVDNELSYLSLKKAIAQPKSTESAALVAEAMATLDAIVDRRPDQMPHAFHIMGRQGLIWSDLAIDDVERKGEFLEGLLRRVKRADFEYGNDMTKALRTDLEKTLLSLAVQKKAT